MREGLYVEKIVWGLTIVSWISLDDFPTFKFSRSKGVCGCVCLSYVSISIW